MTAARAGLLPPGAAAPQAPVRPGTRPRRHVFPGSPDQAAAARRFTRRALGGCPVTDDAVQCVAELCSNALQHTRSSGSTFTVIISCGPSSVRVAVADGGSDTTPEPAPPVEGSETGRGLALVARLAVRWGHHGGPAGRVVWCVLEWPAGAAQAPSPP